MEDPTTYVEGLSYRLTALIFKIIQDKPRKHCNIVSILFLGRYDIATSGNVKSKLKQHCACQRWNLQR